MLPSIHRLRRSREFATTVRDGLRAGRPLLVAHLLIQPDCDEPARVGFVVGRGIGGAVVRNRVRRRLRHVVRERLHSLPRGSLLVVRANPQAADARSCVLAKELDIALRHLTQRTQGQ